MESKARSLFFGFALMTARTMLELLGYLASALIATSLLMRSIVRLRIFNMAGALTFSLYGFLIGAYPVGILNLVTASINVVQLIRLRRRQEIFRILEVRSNAEYLRYFLEFEQQEIHQFFPRFRFDPEATSLALFVLRDLVPAGVLLGSVSGHTLQIDLDYVVPQYRDMKIGRYLFADRVDFFRARGLREILSPADSEVHATYLRRLGFRPQDDGRMYRLSL